MKTSDIYDYNQARLEVTQHHLVFRVAACNDAHIALSSDKEFGNDTTYEVVIGSSANTRWVDLAANTQRLLLKLLKMKCNQYQICRWRKRGFILYVYLQLLMTKCVS